MIYGEQLSVVLGTLFFVGVIITFLIFVFYYLSKFFNEYNAEKADEIERKKLAEEKDNEILLQAKNHTLNYTEEYVKKIKSGKINNNDFDVDFNINLKGSTVKTEIIYAE